MLMNCKTKDKFIKNAIAKKLEKSNLDINLKKQLALKFQCKTKILSPKYRFQSSQSSQSSQRS